MNHAFKPDGSVSTALAVWTLAVVGSSLYSGDWWSPLALAAGVVLLGWLALAITRRWKLTEVEIVKPRLEALVALAWFAGVLLLDAVSRARGVELVNQLSNWLFLVVAPVALLIAVRGGGFRSTVLSVGLSRAGAWQGLRVAGIVSLAATPVLYLVGEQQRLGIEMLIDQRFGAMPKFVVAFLYALFTAAFVEEVFFRGIVQSRLSALFGSRERGLLVASLLFGLLHLPLYNYSEFEPTHGDFLWSLSAVIAEQAVFGVLLGVLWMRTRNLTAPVLVHAFVLALALMTTVRIDGA
jgi:membrane protease YdiL (CAAX protease family)